MYNNLIYSILAVIVFSSFSLHCDSQEACQFKFEDVPYTGGANYLFNIGSGNTIFISNGNAIKINNEGTIVNQTQIIGKQFLVTDQYILSIEQASSQQTNFLNTYDFDFNYISRIELTHSGNVFCFKNFDNDHFVVLRYLHGIGMYLEKYSLQGDKIHDLHLYENGSRPRNLEVVDQDWFVLYDSSTADNFKVVNSDFEMEIELRYNKYFLWSIAVTEDHKIFIAGSKNIDDPNQSKVNFIAELNRDGVILNEVILDDAICGTGSSCWVDDLSYTNGKLGLTIKTIESSENLNLICLSLDLEIQNIEVFNNFSQSSLFYPSSNLIANDLSGFSLIHGYDNDGNTDIALTVFNSNCNFNNCEEEEEEEEEEEIDTPFGGVISFDNIIFAGGFGNGNENSVFTEYPFLLNLIDTLNCEGTFIELFKAGNRNLIYVENPNSGKLYSAFGILICTNTPNIDCLSFYGLGDGELIWSCPDLLEEKTPQIFIDFPWLSDLVLPCSSGEKIQVFEDQEFIYLSNGRVGVLYTTDGGVYCTDSDILDCREIYNLKDDLITQSWSCSGEYLADNVDYNFEFAAPHESMQIYPNPADDILTIEFINVSQIETQFSIYNVLGQKVSIIKSSGEDEQIHFNVDLLDIQSGIYLLERKTGTDREVKKILVKHD